MGLLYNKQNRTFLENNKHNQTFLQITSKIELSTKYTQMECSINNKQDRTCLENNKQV